MMDWLIFNVPELVPRPVLGAGCCAVASTWLVEETIAGLPGVFEVRADDQQVGREPRKEAGPWRR